MFAHAYFPSAFFAPVYYPPAVAAPPTPEPSGGGGSFLHASGRIWRSAKRKEAEQAIEEAARADEAIAAAIGQDRDIKPVLDARMVAEEAYLEVYREQMLARQLEAEDLRRQFEAEVAAFRLVIRRRAALLLLLAQ